jgi:peptide/nickel transport system permease protein
MFSYILRRFLYMILLLVLASIVSFMIIVLPPGDFLTSYINQLESQGTHVTVDLAIALRRQYGLDQPIFMQYLKWSWKMLHGDMGRSFQWQRPVSELINERLPMTLVVSFLSLIVEYAIAIPIGIYSAVRQYSIGDYFFTVMGFIGVSVPNFLLALVLIVWLYKTVGISAAGLYSAQFKGEPWTWAKIWDLLKHLPLPIIVIGMSGTAYIIRVMRGMMLDELNRPYVTTARAKGLTETRLLMKYPVRVAMNPIVSTIGWSLPNIFSGATIAAIVLGLPTIGPILYQALQQQDMFLAASTVMVITALTIIGTLISDILLAWLDPRIRLGD